MSASCFRSQAVFGLLVFAAGAAGPAALAHAGPPPLQAAVKVLVGIAAADSLRRSAHAYENYQAESSVLQRLEDQGLDARKDAIYSILFETTGGAWSDFWSRPDLFFYVDIEGQGTFLVPQIHGNYRGGPILDRVLAEEAPPGARVVVRVMDDDSASDAVWNNLLQTRFRCEATVGGEVTRFVPVRAGASGDIQLIDQDVTIDAPDYVASAVFEVPESEDGVWVAHGTLKDADGSEVGAIQYASVWSAPSELRAQRGLVGSWRGWMVFWLALAGCLLWVLKSAGPKRRGGARSDAGGSPRKGPVADDW